MLFLTRYCCSSLCSSFLFITTKTNYIYDLLTITLLTIVLAAPIHRMIRPKCVQLNSLIILVFPMS